MTSCPNCGAEIRFMWSSAVQTTCTFCRSILVRHDLDLTKVGEVSDMLVSSSPIQIGTQGTFKRTPFTVVGRIVYEYDRGRWNEWHLRTGNGTSAWLSDAMAEYAVSEQVASESSLPAEDSLHVGLPLPVQGKLFHVVSLTRAHYRGVEGELPFEYWDKSEVLFADLDSTTDAFATLDYSDAEPLLFVGEYEEFDELAFTNLREIEGW